MTNANQGRSEPKIERALTLRFQGDWGQANLHRICGWIAQEIWDRSGEGTKIGTWSGRGGSDAVEAVTSGEMDMAMITPAYVGQSALRGMGMFNGNPHTNLRAIGTLPQNDRLVLAIGAEQSIESFAEFRAKRPAIRIATSQNDGVNTIGFAVQTMMAAHGIPRDEFESWGGTYVEHERPFPPLKWFQDGEVDAVFHEAIMSPEWQAATNARPVRYLQMEEGPLSIVHRDLGWHSGVLPAGYLPGLDHDLLTLDFSDFLVLVRADLPDDVVYLMTWCLNEAGHGIERQYRHIPPDRSPVGYPLDPLKISRTSVPLHPAAARFYSDYGYQSESS
jgi:hypothetical protein